MCFIESQGLLDVSIASAVGQRTQVRKGTRCIAMRELPTLPSEIKDLPAIRCLNTEKFMENLKQATGKIEAQLRAAP